MQWTPAASTSVILPDTGAASVVVAVASAAGDRPRHTVADMVAVHVTSGPVAVVRALLGLCALASMAYWHCDARAGRCGSLTSTVRRGRCGAVRAYDSVSGQRKQQNACTDTTETRRPARRSSVALRRGAISFLARVDQRRHRRRGAACTLAPTTTRGSTTTTRRCRTVHAQALRDVPMPLTHLATVCQCCVCCLIAARRGRPRSTAQQCPHRTAPHRRSRGRASAARACRQHHAHPTRKSTRV